MPLLATPVAHRTDTTVALTTPLPMGVTVNSSFLKTQETNHPKEPIQLTQSLNHDIKINLPLTDLVESSLSKQSKSYFKNI